MNFSSVKAITIPEGNVKKVQRGDTILWETPVELLSGMSVSIYYARKNKPNSTATTATYSFTVNIKGIPAEYVQSFGVTMFYYNTATMMREVSTAYQAELLSTDDTIKGVTKTVTFTGADRSYTSASFVGFLKYTDLDGSTKTLATKRVSSVSGSATASA
jgi:hypothetical protein